MTGKKPTILTAIVSRLFRDATLYLTRVTRAPKGFAWSATKTKAIKLEPRHATELAREASRDYGARCTVTDTAGCVLVPAANLDMRPMPAFDGCTIRHQHMPDCKQPSDANEAARDAWLAARRARS